MSALFPTLVFSLCFLTSLACAILLGRSYWQIKRTMLLWSAVCFALLAASNLLVIFDLLMLPDVNLRPARLWLSLSAVSVLLFGFLWAEDKE